MSLQLLVKTKQSVEVGETVYIKLQGCADKAEVISSYYNDFAEETYVKCKGIFGNTGVPSVLEFAISKLFIKTTMPRVRFCWHCARKFQGNHFAEYQTENGTVYVHKDCKRILDGAFNHVRAVDDKGGAELAQKKVN